MPAKISMEEIVGCNPGRCRSGTGTCTGRSCARPRCRNFGTQDIFMGAVLEGDRSRWFKLQPHVIALLLAKGVPLLWEGQEIGESYHVPGSGFARIGRLRPVRWESSATTRG